MSEPSHCSTCGRRLGGSSASFGAPHPFCWGNGGVDCLRFSLSAADRERERLLATLAERDRQIEATTTIVSGLVDVLTGIVKGCCMQSKYEPEEWCKHDGSAHSCYCAAGIAKAALAALAAPSDGGGKGGG